MKITHEHNIKTKLIYFTLFELQANTSKESQLSDINENGHSDDGTNKKPPKKKKVSFKFGLETSDDAHIVKKEPNTIFAPPVSIIKKECLTRARSSESRLTVLTPSRLTVVTQKFNIADNIDNANDIDKLNSLTFKSKFSKSKQTSDDSESNDEQSDTNDTSDEIKRNSDECINSDHEVDNGETESTEGGDATRKSTTKRSCTRANKKSSSDESKSANGKNGISKKKNNKSETESIDAIDKNDGKIIFKL